MPTKCKATARGVVVSIYVHPSAKKDLIETTDEIVAYTREPAEGNRANIAIVKLLSKGLGIPRSNISIIRGSTSRVKEIGISGITPDQLERLNSKEGIEKAER